MGILIWYFNFFELIFFFVFIGNGFLVIRILPGHVDQGSGVDQYTHSKANE